MNITEITENKDGSADYTFDLTQDEIQKLVEYAINDILEKKVKRKKQKKLFNKIINSLEVLKHRFITNQLVYICRDKKHNAQNIIIKFNRKDWAILKDDGTWKFVKSHPNLVTKLRKGEK